jgi:hypothetical protein
MAKDKQVRLYKAIGTAPLLNYALVVQHLSAGIYKVSFALAITALTAVAVRSQELVPVTA